MIGQIQVLDFGDIDSTAEALLNRADALVKRANDVNPRLLGRGGGARRLQVRTFPETAIAVSGKVLT